MDELNELLENIMVLAEDEKLAIRDIFWRHTEKFKRESELRKTYLEMTHLVLVGYRDTTEAVRTIERGLPELKHKIYE